MLVTSRNSVRCRETVFTAPPPSLTHQLLCAEALHTHTKRHSTKPVADLVSTANPAQQDLCRVHQKPLGLYCRTDEALLCFDCVPHHLQHNVATLIDAPADLKTLLEQACATLPKLTEVLTATSVNRGELKGSYEAARKAIAAEFQKVILVFLSLIIKVS
jgi:hypothetical protein